MVTFSTVKKFEDEDALTGIWDSADCIFSCSRFSCLEIVEMVAMKVRYADYFFYD